jgi:LytR cell envelope-related transcriptional attenuator
VNRRVALIVAGVLIVVLAAIVAVISYRRARGHAAAPTQTITRAPSPGSSTPLADPPWANGQRITVEVLNATKVKGLARRAARALRDQGFDVVSTGTNHDQFDSTQVLDRTGHRDWAVLAAKAMGGGTVLVRPDSSREVDLTVLIGASWRAPSQPFYP